MQRVAALKVARLAIAARTTPQHALSVLHEQGVAGFLASPSAMPTTLFARGVCPDTEQFRFSRVWQKLARATLSACICEAEFMRAGRPGDVRPSLDPLCDQPSPALFETAVPGVVDLRHSLDRQLSEYAPTCAVAVWHTHLQMLAATVRGYGAHAERLR